MKPPLLKLLEEYVSASVDLSWFGSYPPSDQHVIVEAHRKARKDLYEALGLGDFLPKSRQKTVKT